MTTELNVDAFDTTEADDAAVRALEDASGASSGEAGFAKLEFMATLQNGAFGGASNGTNYDLRFEVDIEGFVRIALETAKGNGGYDVTWNQIHVGTGVELKRGTWSRDADGNPHYWCALHLPESELGSLGRLATKAKKHGKMVLEPMQGTLGLADGTKVDLTAKA